MPKIKLLPSSLISQIAAGEVIERPAYAVKELVENAIDAGATKIDVHIQAGGQEKITVIDNGEGMDEADLLLSIKKNTTSKLYALDELSRIQSLGFRGEALHSIAVVSHLSIASKQAESELGIQLTLDPQADLEIHPIGMPTGTRVVVENLFGQIPARRKFLRSPAIEFRQIVSIVSALALSQHTISFYLHHNHKLILSLTATDTLGKCINQLLPQSFSNHSLPITFESEFFQLSGMLGKPQLAKPYKTHHFLIINHRPVHSHKLHQVIKRQYASLIDPKTQPPYALHLSLPSELTDVNIHPRKEEIAFMDEAYVANLVQKAIQAAFAEGDLTYQPNDSESIYNQEKRYFGRGFVYDDKTIASTHTLVKEASPIWHPHTLTSHARADILQIHDQYLLFETDGGLALIDQHAAHERILYEQFLSTFKQKRNDAAKTQLLAAQSIRLTPSEVEILMENQTILSMLGFDLSRISVDTMTLIAVPTILKDHPLQRLLEEVANDLDTSGRVSLLDAKSNQVLSYLACRSAIKAGDSLSFEERQNLVQKLAQTKTAYTCPHGRPVKIVMSLAELDKMFKRR